MKIFPLFIPLLILLLSATATTAIEFQRFHVHDLLPSNNTRHRDHQDEDNLLKLKLIHRDTFSGRNYSSHHHRIRHLINRDVHRVAVLTRSLYGATYETTADFGSDVVSGLEEGSGEYFVRLGVGSPPRAQYMVIDSGSDVVWVQCQPCAQCYVQSDPVFDPALSTSFAGVSCSSPLCGLLSNAAGCSAGRCRYQVSYGDGSYTKGTFAVETLTFGGTTVNGIAFGCGHRNHGLFVGAAGLLGLGRGPMSFVGQLEGQLGGVFGYCLSEGPAGGTLVFGRTAAVHAGAVWVPMVRNFRAPSYYYVGLVGLGVGGVPVSTPSGAFLLSQEDGTGGVVMDTGTAVTRLPRVPYGALRDAFAEGTRSLPRAPGVSIFDTCYDLTGYTSVRVPTVSFYFVGGAVLIIPAKNFMIPVDDARTFCFAFAPSASGLSILGNIQQQGIQITVDSANGYVGFGPHTC